MRTDNAKVNGFLFPCQGWFLTDCRGEVEMKWDEGKNAFFGICKSQCNLDDEVCFRRHTIKLEDWEYVTMILDKDKSMKKWANLYMESEREKREMQERVTDFFKGKTS